jgi:uncharacterized membrane protein (DUF485 family)
MIENLSRQRWRISCILTALILFSYFGLLFLFGYRKELMAEILFPGCSLSILLGSGMILLAWISTGIYVWWANNHYDPQVESAKKHHREQA